MWNKLFNWLHVAIFHLFSKCLMCGNKEPNQTSLDAINEMANDDIDEDDDWLKLHTQSIIEPFDVPAPLERRTIKVRFINRGKGVLPEGAFDDEE